jgi:DNA-binding CsgD family transcriptional regulator
MSVEREIRLDLSAADEIAMASLRAFLRAHPSIELVDGAALDDAPAVEPLTESEIDLLATAAYGTPLSKVANETGLAHGTVKNYLSRTYAKLGVHNLTAALRAAEEHGYELGTGTDGFPHSRARLPEPRDGMVSRRTGDRVWPSTLAMACASSVTSGRVGVPTPRATPRRRRAPPARS